jgi:site-specific recombinase
MKKSATMSGSTATPLPGSGQCAQRRQTGASAFTQCRDTLQKIRKHAASTGVSISLTQLLVRISQMLKPH